MNFRTTKMKEAVDVNLTPLIDVVFLLLIFFMVSTTFTKETRLGIVLPETEGQVQVQQDGLIELSITAAGEYRVNGQKVLDNRRSTISAALLKVSKGIDIASTPLVLSADANARHQLVVTAMDVAGKLGFTNINIITQEAQQSTAE